MGGIEIKINNTDISTFGAKLLEYKIGATNTNLNYFVGKNSLHPLITDMTIKPRPITITLVYKGKSRHQVVANISNLASVLLDKCEIYLPDGYHYTSVVTSISESSEVIATEQIVNYQFDAVRHLPQETETLTTSGVFICRSNLETACVYEITTTQRTATINGVTIQNAAGTTIIDGIKKTVTKNGSNAFKDTNLISFPTLKAGLNQINISDHTTVKISYDPTFV